VTEVIGVSDGRHVTVDCWGDPKGFPVFLLHGTPGSRNGPVPRASVLYRLGVRLICYDRPGYGGSDRHKGRTVADAARDVRDIAAELELTEFGVIGRSGGGPHALACAALMDEKILRSVTVLVGLAPSDADDLEWLDGMANSNVDGYELLEMDGNDAMATDLAQRAEQIREDPQSLLSALEKEMTGPDLRIVTDVAIRRQLTGTYKEALRDGAYGWIDDVLAFRRPWGFSLADIRVPVLLWHGEDDMFSPVDHSRWLASHIPDAKIEVQSGMAHFAAVEILPRLLGRMKADSLSGGREAPGGSEGLGIEGPQEPAFSA
jgi:pimeloyl-ACP methyl ester carboxylesterase